MNMNKRKLLFTSVIGVVLIVAAYGLYARTSINNFDIYEIVAYVAYPEKLIADELFWVPRTRTVLLNELDSRSKADLLDSLREKGINPYFVISWANLDLDGDYDRERLKPLLRLLDILDRKGFDSSFLSKNGCSAFHEAAIHEDVTAMGILKERYRHKKIEGNPQAEIPECREALLID